MTSREGRKATALELPAETREAMKNADMPMWKAADQAVRMYFGLDEGSTERALERRIEDLQQERNGLLEQRESINAQIDDLNDRISDLKTQLNELREKKASYKEQIDTILEEMLEHPDRNVLAWMSEIRAAANDEYGRDTDSNIDRVISDLRERRDNQALAIEDFRFNRTGQAPGPNSAAQATTDGGADEPDMKSDPNELLEKLQGDD